MRRAGWWLLVLLATISLPSLASSHPDALIIPGRGIGPFRLGMTPGEIRTATRTAPCDVLATFGNGKATRLETNCGGAYRTVDDVTVGLDPSRMRFIFGTPDRVTASDFANVRGEWLQYTRAGIAFRVVYGSPGNSLIQAIAVFGGSAPVELPQRPAPPTPPAPPPGVGE